MRGTNSRLKRGKHFQVPSVKHLHTEPSIIFLWFEWEEERFILWWVSPSPLLSVDAVCWCCLLMLSVDVDAVCWCCLLMLSVDAACRSQPSITTTSGRETQSGKDCSFTCVLQENIIFLEEERKIISLCTWQKITQ